MYALSQEHAYHHYIVLAKLTVSRKLATALLRNREASICSNSN